MTLAPRKAKATGATRTAPRRQKRDSADRPRVRLGRCLILSTILVGGFFVYQEVNWHHVLERAYTATNRPLASVKIQSEFRFVDQSSLEASVSPLLVGNFMDIDLVAMKASLETNPWIEVVTVERQWPDAIHLTIHEHHPIARWNDSGFISRDGQLVKVKNNETLENLPLLSSSEVDSESLSRHYLIFSEMLKAQALSIQELHLLTANSWKIVFREGFELVLGNDDVYRRLENFSYVYEGYLKEKTHELARIDMRYENGLAVSWRSENRDSNNELIATRAAR